MTVTEIKNLTDKSYVSGTVKGRITSTKNLEGKTMTFGKFGDDTDTIDLTAFGTDIRKFDGKEVALSGMGMRKDTYNGYAKLSINEKTKITVVGDANPVDDAGIDDAPPARMVTKRVGTDEDFIPQTLCHFMGAAAQLAISDPQSDGILKPEIVAQNAVILYKARELATEQLRKG